MYLSVIETTINEISFSIETNSLTKSILDITELANTCIDFNYITAIKIFEFDGQLIHGSNKFEGLKLVASLRTIK